MNRLHYITVLIAAICLASLSAQAQNKHEQDFTFVYIAHDVNTPIDVLSDRLNTMYRDAIDYPDIRATVFYLANSEAPMIVKINTEDDNREDFQNIIYELQHKRAHDLEPMTDLVEIQNALAESLVNDENEPIYQSCELFFYINSTFWELECNENLIAPLFLICGMKELIDQEYMRKINIFHGEDDPLPMDPEHVFSNKYSSLTTDYYAVMPY